MIGISDLLETLDHKNPTALRGLAIVAAAGAIESQTFQEVWTSVNGHSADVSGDWVFDTVLQSRLVEETLDGQWRVRLPFRPQVEAYFQDTGNSDFVKVHRLLAARLQENGQPPTADTVDGRLAFSRWLRHHMLSTDDEAQTVIRAFERAFDEGWVGDSRAIVWIAEQARPELAEQDCEFLAMRGVQNYNEGDRQSAIALFDRLRQAPSRPRTRLVAIALHLRGKFYGEKGKREEALADLAESLKILREIGDRYGQAQVLHTRGQLQGQWNRQKEALADLAESLKILREMGNRYGQAQVLNTRAGLELEDLKKLSAEGQDIEAQVWSVVRDLTHSLVLYEHPKHRSIGYLYLSQAFQLLGDTALTAAVLRLKCQVDRARGPAGRRYREDAERRLRRLEQFLSEEQIDQAEKRLLDLLQTANSLYDDSMHRA